MGIGASAHVNRGIRLVGAIRRYGVGMTYTIAIRNYLSEDTERAAPDIIRFVRGETGGGYHDVQKALYAMVKAGEVGWNRKMGNAGRYRLLPGAAGSTPPPLTGGAGPGSGLANDTNGGAEDDAEELWDDDMVVRWWRGYKAGKRELEPSAVGWMIDRGLARVVMTEEGRKWLEDWS